MHWDTIRPVLLKAFAKQGAHFSEKYWIRFVHQGSSKTRVEYSKNSLAYFQAIQGHSIFFTEVVLSALNLTWRLDCFWVDRKAREDDRQSHSHHFTFLVEIPMKKNFVMIAHFLKQCSITAIGNVIRMPFTG